MALLKAMIKAMRPKQWVKNVFLFAALVFARKYLEVDAWMQALLGFAASRWSLVLATFSMMHGDREADAQHPKKKFRPIATRLTHQGCLHRDGVPLHLPGLGLAWYISPYSSPWHSPISSTP